ncbi:MAG: sn-glycerol-1-phosphate dehydrogenase [Armatimonadota bacterium]|nr:sn-glycerol-1-phosphate dehydrogenase [Armatimonadota bacterium]MCX7777359.1 sn-glycerol-1-phosphate dehydrogenase [Armatimonadota bacterium]MDW8025373.1 sn-glycerol-1-phosphate dehydrogenase [Armatimonadota bacterium]
MMRDAELKMCGLLGARFKCACGREHFIPTKQVVVENEAIGLLSELCERNGMTGKCNLLADSTTYEVCGREAASELRSSGIHPHEIVLDNPRADEKTCEAVISLANPHGEFWLAVGSGTINDIAKFVSTKASQPYAVVATAPSMNGYTSSIAALTVGGLKMTLPANPPVFVLADLKVLCEAPYELIAAGLGDAISKPVSNADWMLAHIFFGEHICEFCLQLLSHAEPLYVQNASALKSREPTAIRALMEALCLAGIAMTIAGSSSPVSGGEHLISHALDMHASVIGRKVNLHGAQVGVATLFSVALYERLFELDVRKLNPYGLAQRYTALDEWITRLRRFFGEVYNRVFEQFAMKYPASQDEFLRRVECAISVWEDAKSMLCKVLRSHDELRKALLEAGAPTKVDELGINRGEFREAVMLARTIRSRYTVLDLASELGILPDELDELMERSQI